jgi:hypothetical protein
MKKQTLVFGTTTLFCLFLMTVALAGVVDFDYYEDFTTKLYCDTLNTTALWNTSAGELSLPAFELILVGSLDTPGDARDVAVEGNYAYVADRYSGLRIMDISDPTNPALAGVYNTSGIAYGVTIDGDYAYVSDDDEGVKVIDISDPTNPIQVGNYDTPGYSYEVAIAGNYAYVADHDDGGLQVLDISDPTSPTLAGSYDTPSSARGVALAGNYAFVADLEAGLLTIDISDLTNPVLAGSYDTPGASHKVALAGDYAYVADSDAGLQVINITDPTVPTLAGSYDTPNYAWHVAVSGDHAYVADNFSGIHWLDIYDPTNPTLVDNYDTPEASYHIAVAGDYIYVADYDAGLLVFERSFETGMNTAQSTVLPGAGYISRVKLVPTQTGTIEWEFSADDGGHWQVIPDTLWTVLAHKGAGPKWRATLIYTPGGDLPVCTSLDVETILSPVAVLIQSFQARGVDHGVELAWDIEANEEIKGFRIYRGTDGHAPNELVNTEGLIRPESRSYIDDDIHGGGSTLHYALAVVKVDDSEVISQTVTVNAGVRSVALHQNYPNPFNPTTTISFVLPEKALVDLSVYNLRGQLVRTLVDEVLDEGISEAIWNGTDARGNPVASGVYFYRLRAGKNVMTKKMILLK